jgi:hypothetical protein
MKVIKWSLWPISELFVFLKTGSIFKKPKLKIMDNSELKSTKTDFGTSSDQRESASNINIEDWKIDGPIPKKMMDHRREVGNDMSNIVDYNDDVRNAIMIANKGKDGTWEEARYKDDDDEIRYCKNWKIPAEPDGSRGKAGRVKKYKTKIFKVSDKTKDSTSEPTYYDIARIVPPPQPE